MPSAAYPTLYKHGPNQIFHATALCIAVHREIIHHDSDVLVTFWYCEIQNFKNIDCFQYHFWLSRY